MRWECWTEIDVIVIIFLPCLCLCIKFIPRWSEGWIIWKEKVGKVMKWANDSTELVVNDWHYKMENRNGNRVHFWRIEGRVKIGNRERNLVSVERKVLHLAALMTILIAIYPSLYLFMVNVSFYSWKREFEMKNLSPFHVVDGTCRHSRREVKWRWNHLC